MYRKPPPHRAQVTTHLMLPEAAIPSSRSSAGSCSGAAASPGCPGATERSQGAQGAIAGRPGHSWGRPLEIDPKNDLFPPGSVRARISLSWRLVCKLIF